MRISNLAPHKKLQAMEQAVEVEVYKPATIQSKMEGYKVLPPMDDKYQPRDGLEGPFSTLSGKVVYYDPKEGSYYDPDTDIYLSYDEFRQYDNDYKDMEDERDEVEEAQIDKMKFVSKGFDDRRSATLHNDHLVAKKKASGKSYVHNHSDGKFYVVDVKDERDEVPEARSSASDQAAAAGAYNGGKSISKRGNANLSHKLKGKDLEDHRAERSAEYDAEIEKARAAQRAKFDAMKKESQSASHIARGRGLSSVVNNESYAEEDGYVSNCCGAPMSNDEVEQNNGVGQCSDCYEMASAEKESKYYESVREEDDERKPRQHYIAKDKQHTDHVKAELEELMSHLELAITYRYNNSHLMLGNGNRAGTGELETLKSSLNKIHASWDEATELYGM